MAEAKKKTAAKSTQQRLKDEYGKAPWFNETQLVGVVYHRPYFVKTPSGQQQIVLGIKCIRQMMTKYGVRYRAIVIRVWVVGAIVNRNGLNSPILDLRKGDRVLAKGYYDNERFTAANGKRYRSGVMVTSFISLLSRAHMTYDAETYIKTQRELNEYQDEALGWMLEGNDNENLHIGKLDLDRRKSIRFVDFSQKDEKGLPHVTYHPKADAD